MVVSDRRIKRTQRLLAEALITLTLNKSYEAVTIRDITEHADVGYATFFRHYHDKDELLLYVVDVVLAELSELLLPHSAEIEPAVVGTLLFQYVQEHSDVVRVLLSSQGSSSVMKHVIETSTQNVLSSYTPQQGSAVPGDIAAYHWINSTIALIQWWLVNDMPYTPERMGTIYHQLICQPVCAVAFV